jgi:phage/plasmid-associated DNA primase
MIMHGETIKARNPYGRVFDIKPRALHLFSCNDWPAAPGVSNAFWDRWVAIRFERRFRDTEVVIKDIGRTIASTETGALVKWFLDAGRELLVRGRYTIPSSSISIMGEWRAEGDSVAAWRAAATEHCNLPEPKHWMSAATAYADYKMWCDTNGFRGVVNSTNFGKRLKTAGIESVRKTAGIFYRLLKVTPPEDEDERSPF